MNFKIIILFLMLFGCLSFSKSLVVTENSKSGRMQTSDLLSLETNAKLFNLGSLFDYGNSGYYPNINRPGGGFLASKFPTLHTGGYYPNNNYYPSTSIGTNILGGGYGGYGGNGGLRQYYGYIDPSYGGQRNRGFGYYTNTNIYGLPLM